MGRRRRREAAKNINILSKYHRYLNHLMRSDYIAENLREMFQFHIEPETPKKAYALLIPLNALTSSDPLKEFLNSHLLLSSLQKATILLNEKAPGRLIVSAYHLKDANLPASQIIIPHPLYNVRTKGKKAGINSIVKLRYWTKEDVRDMAHITKNIVEYPHIAANTIQESIGSLYVLKHYFGGENGIIPLRSIRFNLNNNKQLEIDLMTIKYNGNRTKPSIDLFEMKSSDGMFKNSRADPSDVFKKKADNHKPLISKIKEILNVPIRYHFVITGHVDKYVKNAAEIATQVLRSNPVTEEHYVHGVLVKKEINPIHLTKI